MFNGSQKKIVLCATANNLLAGLWRAGKLQGSQTFNNDEAGHQAFAEFLQQYPTTPVYLLADAVEEDYRLERVPHTVGTAKRELIERKLKQFYRGLDYRTAHFTNRETDHRKDDWYLFVALNNDDFLQDWVTQIKAAESQLVGVYLLPMLSQILVKHLKVMSPHILLCEKLSSGLRQTYLHNGCLRMSRLVPNVPTESNQLGFFYSVEIEKTRLYLISKRFITRETPINLMLTSIDGNTQHISQGLSEVQGLACIDVNLSQIAQHLNLPAYLIEKMPELLHMQLLASGKIVDNLAPAPLIKLHQFSQFKQGIKIVTVALGVIGLCAAAWFFKQGLDHKSSFNQAAQDTIIQQHRYDEVAKNFSVTTISADNLKVAVALDKTIATYPKSPRRVMLAVSAALELSPEVQLDRLRWVFTSDLNIKDDDKLITMPVTNLQANAGATQVVNLTKLYELGFVTAEISNFNGDYRGALNSVNTFVANLKKQNSVAEVVVLQAPVNVSSYVDLQGSTADEQSTQKLPALFKLKVILNAPEAPDVK